ncbi:hypothetical protein [Shinella sp. NM-101]|uniref:hypothetical protein n=1 Tax=Shinella sp. NM-101 TaxID=2744455 RepID=UPI001F416B03|nr:hypothetical protein [Shinella sp. NM-101]
MTAPGIAWSSDLTDDEERRRERRREKRERFLFFLHLALACVPAQLFCILLLYLLYWSKP